MWRYLKEAFWARVDLPATGSLPINALVVFGFGIVGCAEHAVWLLGLGLETAYLYTLATNPRFQKVVTARTRFQTQQSITQNRNDLLGHLSPESKARAEKLADKIRRAAAASRKNTDLDLLGDSNLEALEKLGALHLRLLGLEQELQNLHQGTDQAALLRQSTALEEELHATTGPLSNALRESKQATLTLTQKRLANARRRAESLAEVRSDLARIEAQVELALEEASLDDQSGAISGNLNLLNRILESNSALRGETSLDWSSTDAGSREIRPSSFEG